jgi:hypothetical protein
MTARDLIDAVREMTPEERGEFGQLVGALPLVPGKPYTAAMAALFVLGRMEFTSSGRVATIRTEDGEFVRRD